MSCWMSFGGLCPAAHRYLWQEEAEVCAILQDRAEKERLKQKCRVRLAIRVAGNLLGCPPHTMLHADPDPLARHD